MKPFIIVKLISHPRTIPVFVKMSLLCQALHCLSHIRAFLYIFGWYQTFQILVLRIVKNCFKIALRDE